MSNPYVFIVGCPRSGTTLLRHIVSAHPRMVITPEAHWIPVWYQERRCLTPDGMVTRALIPELLTHPKFALFHLGREDLAKLVEKGARVPYSSFITGIFDLYGKANGRLLVGNKTPDSVRRMGTLHALWPRARFVHLIRDGRDVALSLIDWPKIKSKKPGTFPTWEDDPVSTAALWWELNVRRGRDTGRSLGPELYHEVRYESLVTRPDRECRELCKFLGVEFDEAMLRWNESDPIRAEGSGSLRSSDSAPGKPPAWQPTTPSLRDWRKQMAAGDVKRFEAVASALLDELGYPRAFPSPRPEAIAHASRVRDQLGGVPQDVRPYGLA